MLQTGYPSIDKPWLKYYSVAAINSEPFNGSIYEHIKKKNINCLGNYALQYFGKKITYKEMLDRADLIAQALIREGVRRGDNVILLMSSCPELVYLLLALNKIGAVANMINPLFTEEQIKDRVNDTDANLMFVLDQLHRLTEHIFNDLCIKKMVVVPIINSMPIMTKHIAGIKLHKKIDYNNKLIRWNDFLRYGESVTIDLVNASELPAIVVYSSGTTGASKGIVLTNKGINSTIAHYEYTGFEYDRNWSYLQIIPTWFSTGAVFCLFMPLCLGLCVILEPVFSKENFDKDIRRYKPNMIMGATSLWLYFLSNLKKKKMDLSFIKYPITGGEKILADTEIELNDILKQCGCDVHMTTGYGMCELGSTASATSVKYYKYGSTGYPIKDVIIGAFDIETNRECKYKERGEIRVLTPSRMKEYYKRPDATEEFFWKDLEGREWGCTGDVGYVDEDGFVFVEGRATDYFTTASNERIYNFDIENVILKIKAVEQCEVVGRKNPNGYEESFAFVLLKEVADASAVIDEINKICNKELKPEQVPVKIKVINEFPVKPSGKRNMEQLIQIASEE